MTTRRRVWVPREDPLPVDHESAAYAAEAEALACALGPSTVLIDCAECGDSLTDHPREAVCFAVHDGIPCRCSRFVFPTIPPPRTP
jgi:hypothetical protein